MKFRHAAALALGLSLIAGTGQAQMMSPQGTEGWYLRGEGGWNHTQDLSIRSGSALRGGTSADEGYIVGGAVGYGFGMFRAELNIDYRHNDFDSIHVSN